MKLLNRGFSLIEMMVVVAIIGVISAVAVPSYLDNVKKGRRTEAMSLLSENAQFMQRFFTENDRFDVNKLNAPVVLPVTKSPKTGTAVYNITLSAVTSTTYTLQATPVAGGTMATDVCGSLSINHLGQQFVTGTETVEKCWTR